MISGSYDQAGMDEIASAPLRRQTPAEEVAKSHAAGREPNPTWTTKTHRFSCDGGPIMQVAARAIGFPTTDECTPAAAEYPSTTFRAWGSLASRCMPSTSIPAGLANPDETRRSEMMGHQGVRTTRVPGRLRRRERFFWRIRRSPENGFSEARAKPPINTRTCNKLRRSTG